MPPASLSSQKSIGVFGSIAFDHLYKFDGSLRDFLHADDNPQKTISISLFCKERQVRDGGCGANIAHTLSLLETPCALFGTVGYDAQNTINRLHVQGINVDGISFTDLPTATASIVTDRAQNQSAMFYAGALTAAARPPLSTALHTLSCLIVSPEDPDRFEFVVKTAQKYRLPYYCDPGQVIAVLPPEFLRNALTHAAGVFCNAYESELLCKKLGCTLEELVQLCPLMVVTDGERGVTLYQKGMITHIPAVPAIQVQNITGCGDGFRAGFLAGMWRGLSLLDAAKIGVLVATFIVEGTAPQITDFSLATFRARYAATFHAKCPV